MAPRESEEPADRSRSLHSSVEALERGWSQGRQEGGSVKYIQEGLFPSAVSEKNRQGREVRARWAWVEPRVWSERMLAALESGVKGKKWFSLNDKVSREKTLQLAWEQVQRNGGSAGIDAISVKRFSKIAEGELTRLKGQLEK